jgi:hypothetical protein
MTPTMLGCKRYQSGHFNREWGSVWTTGRFDFVGDNGTWLGMTDPSLLVRTADPLQS